MNGSGTRSLTALYVAAPFSMGYVDFYTFLMPLYALSLGFDAAAVGILVGARSVVAMLLSIHIGVLMDRFGTRKVSLFFVWASMVLAPLFPLVPWFWSLLVLQLVNGAAVSFAWSGAQTLIAQLARGEARYLGRFTFFARLGSTTAPLLGGAMWDFGGTWLAYSIGVIWGGILTVALLCAPEAEFFASPHHAGAVRARFRARDAWPRFSDYWASLMLLAIPAIALSLAIMAMRNSTYSIQTSVYVVYLKQVGLVGTTIGFLFSAAEIASGFGALFAGRVMGFGNAQRTMLSGTAISILLIALTPLLGGILVLLLLFQAMRGWLEGVIQPLVLSVQARAAGRHQQGAVVGLRQTGQRFTAIVVPPIMGVIADRFGVGESFFVVGGFMLLLCIPLALIIRRVGSRQSLDESLAGATD
jgi:MFS family permease